ncbi:hypothetical protein BC936DRAFT_141218 [Jimgerdemannia flammicorona]|uniref:Uncharacterized protein n=2 Tax=Jimgerdemannia flammicorona TaxID=994334 RepID=A0A433A2P8_9FUNG|nr:hypothetical protein BC936DRAFT_141218 [Jimgerdemannia flammicorona]RUS31504.1 hypothetical protein BC938DRAFT_477683 [Jimgerdemannia flammicorona]
MPSILRSALCGSVFAPRAFMTSHIASLTTRRFQSLKPLQNAAYNSTFTKTIARLLLPPSSLPTHPIRRTFISETKPVEAATTNSPAKSGGKIRDLLRKYGATGVVVYLAVSAINLGATFLAIQAGGADSVKRLEDWMVDTFGRWGIFKKQQPTNSHASASSDGEEHEELSTTGPLGGFVTGDISAERGKSGEKPSAASIFVIAYGIHKTVMLPFRVGVTAAITPMIVRRLQAMGWSIGRKVIRKM